MFAGSSLLDEADPGGVVGPDTLELLFKEGAAALALGLPDFCLALELLDGADEAAEVEVAVVVPAAAPSLMASCPMSPAITNDKESLRTMDTCEISVFSSCNKGNEGPSNATLGVPLCFRAALFAIIFQTGHYGSVL